MCLEKPCVKTENMLNLLEKLCRKGAVMNRITKEQWFRLVSPKLSRFRFANESYGSHNLYVYYNKTKHCVAVAHWDQSGSEGGTFSANLSSFISGKKLASELEFSNEVFSRKTLGNYMYIPC